jgi:hypothetical protein
MTTTDNPRHIGTDGLAHVARWPGRWTEGDLWARCDAGVRLGEMVAPGDACVCPLCESAALGVVVVECEGVR